MSLIVGDKRRNPDLEVAIETHNTPNLPAIPHPEFLD